MWNESKTILVEDASRFERDLMVQELGFQRLQEAGFSLVAVGHPAQFTDSGPTGIMLRQILGAVA